MPLPWWFNPNESNAAPDPDREEREKLASDPDVEERAKKLIRDPGVSIEDARALHSAAKRLAVGYMREGFGSEPKSQAYDARQTAVINTPAQTIFGAPVRSVRA